MPPSCGRPRCGAPDHPALTQRPGPVQGGGRRHPDGGGHVPVRPPCIDLAAATAVGVPGLLGEDAKDAGGERHPGLPWAGCAVLSAPAARLAEIRARAAEIRAEAGDIFVADMPVQAQSTRIYDEYLRQVSETDTADIAYHAVSLVGPRNRIGKLVHRLQLMP